MNVKQRLKKLLKSALVFAMVFALAGTTLAKAYATYFPIIVQHVFLDDAEKAKQEEQAKQEAEGVNTDASEESTESPKPSVNPEELKNLTSTLEIQMKGVHDGYQYQNGDWTATDGTHGDRFNSDSNKEEIEAAKEAGNFQVDNTYTETSGDSTYRYSDVTVKTDVIVGDDDKETGIAEGEAAIDTAMDRLFSDENDEAAQLLSELQAAMNGGTLAQKYDVERKLLALCQKEGLDVPTEEDLNQFYPYQYEYIYDEDGNCVGSEKVYDYSDAKGRARASEYKLNFLTGFTAKFRQTCEAMAKDMPGAATLELVELDSQDTSEAAQTIENSLAENPGVTSEQAAAAAEVVADMLEVVDSWSKTASNLTVKGTNVGLGGGGTSTGFRETTEYMGSAEIDEASKQVLLDNGYKSSSLEIQVVVQLWKDKLDKDGNQVLDRYGRRPGGQEEFLCMMKAMES